jgi:hypothetical protein
MRLWIDWREVETDLPLTKPVSDTGSQYSTRSR